VLGLGYLVDLIVLVDLDELAEAVALTVTATMSRRVCATIHVLTLPSLTLESKHVLNL